MKIQSLLLILSLGFLIISCGGHGRALVIKSNPADAEVCIKGKAKSEYFSNQKSCVGTTPFEAEEVTIVDPDGEKKKVKFKDVESDKEKFYVVVSRSGYLSEAVEVPKWDHTLNLKSEMQGQMAPLTQTTPTQSMPASQTQQQAPANTGILKLQSTPSGAVVSINNVIKGNTPIEVILNPGSYQIRLEMPDYQTVERNVNIESDQNMNLNLALQKAH